MPAIKLYKRICKYCGAEFETSSKVKKFCNQQHYKTCECCGKQFEIKNMQYIPKTCSKECERRLRLQHAQETNLQKYGVKNAGYTAESQEKIKKTNQAKYGVDYTFQSKEVKKKSKSTLLNRYDVDNAQKSQLVQAKTKRTCEERYGASNVLCRDSSVRKKFEQDNLQKYGTTDAGNTKEACEKRIQTNLEKYGVWYTCMSDSTRFKTCKSEYNQRFEQMLLDCNIEFEREFPIENRQYDFRIDNVLIEIDPTYTHNIVSTKPYTQINTNYHRDKSLLAKKYGYRCIHVFEWDNWSKLINQLLPRSAVYARNCELKCVDNQQCSTFLDQYHLQNSCTGQTVRFGLFYNDHLVEIMTFGKPRYNKKYQWELLRLCTEPSINVVGGASKLFSYFIYNYRPDSILSYCDLSKFIGSVYEKIGMQHLYNSEPSKIWSKDTQYITDNLLRSRGYDQLFHTNYGKGISNEELMLQNGWLPVMDCGQGVFEWRSNSL